MQFTRIGNCFTVVRITGPSHNYLGIEFGRIGDSPEDVVVESLTGDGGSVTPLSATDVRKSVLVGVAEANQKFGTSYIVKRIKFVQIDSPPTEIYRELASSIVERMVKMQPFTEVT